ncbi:MAG: SDR family NAD(P)-dependent oxidoreductase [Gammaproteobacteria bacterium]
MNDDNDQLFKALVALGEAREKLKVLESRTHEAIAIVGMGCRFPGGANSPDEFWELLQQGFDASIEVPSTRWNIDEYYAAEPDVPGKMISRKASFITTPIDEFDAAFFEISARETEYLDPQQRLLLEVTWEALENANIKPKNLKKTIAGVFIGISSHDYGDLLSGTSEDGSAYIGTGNSASVASGRIAYMLGLQGPCMSIDTACSSSLVALHQACETLRHGESDLAVVGGVNVLLSRKISIDFSLAHMLAPDGHCKTFDKSADGYARGEGCGVIILKRLSDAKRDKDTILALIKGSAVNQDGASSGLTVPNGPAQEVVIKHALAQAKLKPDEIDYIEAHGTGTALGDPIEINALYHVFGADQEDNQRTRALTIGTVKTNIGHLEAASGIAGIIKTILTLQHEQIPRHLHFKERNPQIIDFAQIPAQLPLQSIAWPKQDNHIRRAGISSFGFSGTNAHVILEEAPAQEEITIPAEIQQQLAEQQHLLMISAKTAAALAQQIERYLEYLKSTRDTIQDICYTSQIARTRFVKVIAVVGKTREELIAHLENRNYLDEKDIEDPNYIYSDQIKPYLKKATLPTYSFERQHYWASELAAATSAAKGIGAYALEWQPVNLAMGEESNATVSVLVLGLGALSKQVNTQITEKHLTSREIILSKQFDEDLLSALSADNQPKRVIWCVESPEITDTSDLASYHRLVSECWLALVKRCAEHKSISPLRIGILRMAREANPAASILTGLCRVSANEFPHLRWSQVEVADDKDIVNAVNVLLDATMPADEWYYDGTQWLSLRLVKQAIDEQKELKVTPEGSYLITGGLGAIGQAYAQALIAQGAQHIILVSRRPPEGAVLDRISHWREIGITVNTQTLDISDGAAVAACIADVERSGYPLKGIIHAAGVLSDGILVNQDWDKFKMVLAGKAWGAWNLHTVTLQNNITLDFFIACSSIAAILGSPGQSNYAAANTFLDGLMRYRQLQGLPGTSIAWGPWANEGMAAELTELQRKRWERYGITPLSAQEALSFSAHIDSANSAIVALNERAWQEPLIPPLLSKLVSVPEGIMGTPYEDWCSHWWSLPATERKSWLLNSVRLLVQNTLGIRELGFETMPDNQGFFERGMDSLMAVEVTNHLQAHLPSQSIPNTVCFDYPSITTLTDYLQTRLEASPALHAPRIIYDYSSEPIAIVGMAGRFPQAADVEVFWDHLLQGVDGITEVPRERWDNALYYSANPDEPGKMITRWGGFIEQVDQFDAAFFGISPKEAMMLDPQQRLILETSWHALEEARINPLSLKDSQTGVYIGISGSDYMSSLLKNEQASEIDAYLASGNALSAAAGRLSYTLGLRGPSLAIDTACSSSLVAIHEACEALRHGACTLALSGGVNLILLPEININLSKAHMLSPEGHCKTFDAGADGYVRSDGCGMLVLKRLCDAQRDQDPILALIKGSSVNQDGASGGLTVPNGLAQQEVMHQALAMAHLEPAHITYLEAHGTGTSLGDPIEMRAIQEVYTSSERTQPLVVGAVKSSIGHLEAAAGVAGVIKAVLALNHQCIPKNLHFSILNPQIELSTQIVLPTQTTTWKTNDNAPRRAAVSSFGFAGTLAHMILEEAPAGEISLIPEAMQEQLHHQHHVLIISAKTETALSQQVEHYIEYLKSTHNTIQDICYSSQIARTRFEKVIGVTGQTSSELITHLESKNYLAVTEFENTDSLYSDELKPYLKKVALPLYPFQRQRYWALSHRIDEFKTMGFNLDVNRHPFLQHKLSIPQATGWIYESYISENWPEFIKDHLIYGLPVVAGATYLSMLLSWIKESDLGDLAIEEVSFQEALIIEPGQQYHVQVVIDRADVGRDYTFSVYSRNVADAQEDAWRLHVQGILRSYTQVWDQSGSALSERFLSRASVYDAVRHHEIFDAISITLGPHFQWLEQAWVDEGEVLARFRVPEPEEETSAYVIYPGLMDSLFQSAFARLAQDTHLDTTPYIPFALERLYVAANTLMPRWGYVRFEPAQDNTVHSLSITLLDVNLNVIGEITHLVSRAASQQKLLQALRKEKDVRQWCYAQTWRPYAGIAEGVTSEEELNESEKIVYYDAREQENKLRVTSQVAQRLLTFIQKIISQNTGVSRIVIITEQAYSLQREVIHLSQAMLNGLIKTAILEHPELHIRQLDLSSGEALEPLLAWLEKDSDEESLFAYRDHQWYVARIVTAQEALKAHQQLLIPAHRYQLIKSASGAIEELTLREQSLLSPQGTQVVIAPRAVGLNFRDVLNTMNLYPGDPGPLGIECAGVITAIGEEVTKYHVGDEVLGLVSGGFASEVITDERIIIHKPQDLSFNEASAIPVVFLTAYYSLITLAKLQAGETVLIHAGTGGVGLAAIQIAQYCKANIIATVGSAEKRDYLTALGIEHVLDSRSLTYREAIRDITQQRGVDVVLNSLSGKGFIEATLDCIVAQGRFIEIGKRDIWSAEEVSIKRPEVTYYTVALDAMSAEEPQTVEKLLTELMPLFANKTLTPIHQTIFPLSQTISAFKYLQQAKQVGKVVITLPPAEIQFSSKAGYLITGGLRGIGLEVAKYLSERGAGKIILVARSEPNAAAKAVLTELKARGTQVSTYQVDISIKKEVKKLLTHITSEDFPLKGIFHAAGSIDDSPLDKQTKERFEKVFAPKSLGAWYLHELTQEQHITLDHFVLFSSIASLNGSPAQSNYATANSFLDGLAQWRQQQHLTALSINWGPWAQVGMAKGLVTTHQRRGLIPFKTQEGIQALDYALHQNVAELEMVHSNWQRMSESFMQIPSWLNVLLERKPESVLLKQLQAAPQEQREAILKSAISQEIRQVLGLSADQTIDENKGFFEMGMDSLMALELKNRLQALINKPLSNTIAFDYPSVADICSSLLTLLDIGPKLHAQKDEEENKPTLEISEKIKKMSKSDIDHYIQGESND